MKKTVFLSMIAVVLLVVPSLLLADQNQCQDTVEEMAEVFRQKPMKTRAFGKRAIVVMEKTEQTVEKTTIYVDNSLMIPKVKTIIHFDYNSANLRSESYAQLNRVAQAMNLQDLKGKSFVINGHTDSDGTEEYNYHLSYERANAVKNFLTGACNISQARLRVRGYGESDPLKKHEYSPQDKQLNRRVEFEVVQ